MTYIKKELEGLTKEQLLLFVVAISAMFPYALTYTVLCLFAVHLVYTKNIRSLFKKKTTALYFLGLICTSFIASMVFANFEGLLFTIAILVFILYACYYCKYGNMDITRLILLSVCILSVVAMLYALVVHISNALEYGYSIFTVPDKVALRAKSFFSNPNYYATMIEFVVLIAMYFIITNKDVKSRCFFVGIIIVNILALYLTACRTAWGTFAFSIPILAIFSGEKKLRRFILALCLVAVVAVIIRPSIIPRMDSIGRYFNGRVEIWQSSISYIKHSVLFGQGPFSYLMNYNTYGGAHAVHSHSLYLEMLLSFGLIPTSLIGCYVVNLIKNLFKIWKSSENRPMIALIYATIISALSHGVFDFTLFWGQTALVFIVILGMKHFISRRCFEEKNE